MLTDWLQNAAAPIAAAYLAVNVFVFALYGADKYKAIHHKWRIPESVLITAAVFGAIGALCGMYLLHHKTKKPKFYITVPLIFIAEIVAVFASLY